MVIDILLYRNYVTYMFEEKKIKTSFQYRSIIIHSPILMNQFVQHFDFFFVFTRLKNKSKKKKNQSRM